MSLKHEISLVLNGVRTRASVALDATALAMLRDAFGLTGTKYACGEGECGACTIIVDGVSRCACLMFAVDCDGRTLTTIEGLADDPKGERIERAFVQCGAVQCGFCTPGMVMQAKHWLDTHPQPDRASIERGIEGNLCRCTGYVKIVDAIEQASHEPEAAR